MSSYSKLLSKIVAESGYSSKYIVEELNKLGSGMDTTRFSKLQSGSSTAPSEEVSTKISNICNVDERKLVIEGYIEKAPPIIRDIFTAIKDKTMIALKAYENVFSKEQMQALKNEYEKETISDNAIEILDGSLDEVNITAEGFNITNNEVKFIFNEPIALKVKDNAMCPIVPENAKIILKLEANYSNGDILAIKVKKEDSFIVRYVLFAGKEIVLTSLNREYKTLSYKLSDIVILGKVARVITDLQ